MTLRPPRFRSARERLASMVAIAGLAFAALVPADLAWGTTVIIPKVYFERGSAVIGPRSEPVVRELAHLLQDHPEILLVGVEGHTRSSGSDARNVALSDRRAQAVVDLVVREGIDPARLVAKGWGETRPVAPNDSRPNRERNDRVEFVVLKVSE